MESLYSSALNSSQHETQTGGLPGNVPIRVHSHQCLEVLAIFKARSNWCGGTAVKNVQVAGSNGCIHPMYGGLSSLTIPECLPGRLPIVSYANELFLLLDDCLKACREPNVGAHNLFIIYHKLIEYPPWAIQKIQAIVNDVTKVLDHQSPDFTSQEIFGLSESNRKTLRNVVSTMTEVDPKRAETTFKLWSQYFEQQIAGTNNPPSILDDYLAWRIQRFGWWRPLLLFGCGINISPRDEPTLVDLSHHAFSAIALTTDLFTWDEMVLEAKDTRTTPEKIPNAVGCIMQDQAIGVDAAKVACRDIARDCTQQFLGTVERARTPGLYSPELVRYLENLLLMVGGYAVWCESCPRYNRHTAHSPQQLKWMATGPQEPSTKMGSYAPIYSADLTPNMMSCQPQEKPTTIHDNIAQSDGNTIFPWQYTAQSSEKDVIRKLINALRSWHKVPDSSASTIRRSVELIHVSSKMLDDIEDGVPLRRGRPAAHIVFGVPQTVKSSKVMTIKGIKELAKLGNARCMRILLQEVVKKASVGQHMDNHWTSTCISPTAEDHLRSLDKKSGVLIRLIDKLMSAASPLARPSKPPTHQLITLFARLYALRVDCPDLTSEDTKGNRKSFSIALDEGKYSLLLIHALEFLPEDHSLLLRGIIMQRRIVGRFMPEHEQFVLDMLKESKGFEYLAGLVKEVESEVSKALEEVEEQVGTDGGLRGFIEGVH